ncbi:MAG TPA: 3'-5' exonuclease [Pyrinomonadaceae bacterium]|nr:3'-5' exonuclease [Pyrinomonadaceae bacterium]
MKETYISVDVESSGPIPGAYSLLSIGACVVGNTGEAFYAEIQPINDAYVPEAIEVAGKSMEELALSGQTPESAMKSFRNWLATVSYDVSPVFVGFNAAFDWSFINWYFHTYLGENPFGIGGIDIKSFYMGMCGCSWEDTRSSHISATFKGPSHHTHNALDDAKEQAEMFELMLKAVSVTKQI